MLRFVLLALGVAMVLVALAWRARDLRRRAGGVEGALRSPDPLTRTRALREIASVGLRPWAAMLLERTSEVGDGVEADELVWLIGACQWEPADDPAIVQLRLWAARRLERVPGAASTRVGAAPPPVRAPEPEPEPEPERAPDLDLELDLGPEQPSPADIRPAIVDEIERIVGSPVLALTFVPLVPGGS